MGVFVLIYHASPSLPVLGCHKDPAEEDSHPEDSHPEDSRRPQITTEMATTMDQKWDIHGPTKIAV